MKLLLLLPLVTLVTTTTTASPYGDAFATGKPGDYLEENPPPGKIRIESRDGGNALVLTDTQATLKAVPVSGQTAYRVSFEAGFSGEVESLEHNRRFDLLAQPSERSPALPSREIEFLDRNGKAIGDQRVFAMPFRNDHEYTDDFHTPPGAVALRLKITSGNGVTLSLRNLRIDELPADPEAFNLNPTFDLGPFNYSGWHNIASGGKLIESDGQTLFDTKYGSRGTTFPLAGPGTYALSARATGNGYNATAHLDVYDAEGKVLMRATVRHFNQTNYFVLPPGATAGSLLVYSCLLEEVRVKRVGDEEAINTLRD